MALVSVKCCLLLFLMELLKCISIWKFSLSVQRLGSACNHCHHGRWDPRNGFWVLEMCTEKWKRNDLYACFDIQNSKCFFFVLGGRKVVLSLPSGFQADKKKSINFEWLLIYKQHACNRSITYFIDGVSVKLDFEDDALVVQIMVSLLLSVTAHAYYLP